MGALADMTPIRFQLDWRFEGPAAPFLMAAEKGRLRSAFRYRQPYNAMKK
jgi:hypothetical protein